MYVKHMLIIFIGLYECLLRKDYNILSAFLSKHLLQVNLMELVVVSDVYHRILNVKSVTL